MAGTIEYVLLDPITLKEVETGGQRYRKITTDSGSIALEAFNETKTETKRIDDQTVADVSYVFDFELDEYVELSRIERTDILIPPIDEIAELKAENVALREQQIQISTDLQGFMDFYFSTI